MQVQSLLDAYSRVFRDDVNTVRAQMGGHKWSAKTAERNIGTLKRVLPWLMYYTGCSMHQVDLRQLVNTNTGMLYASFLRQKKQGDLTEVRRAFQQFNFLCAYFTVTSEQAGVNAEAATKAQQTYKGVMSQLFTYVDASRKQRKEDVATHRPDPSTLAVMITAWQASIVDKTRVKVEQELSLRNSLSLDTARSLRDVLMLCVLLNYGPLVSRPSFINTPKTSKYAEQPCTHESCARGKTCTGNYFKFDAGNVVLVLSHHKNEHKTRDRLSIKFTDPIFVWMLGVWEVHGRAAILDNARCLVGRDIHSPVLDPELAGDGDGEGLPSTSEEHQPSKSHHSSVCTFLLFFFLVCAGQTASRNSKACLPPKHSTSDMYCALLSAAYAGTPADATHTPAPNLACPSTDASTMHTFT